MVKILEDKDLLLRDLCARLPYETIYANITWEDGIVRNKTFINTGVISDLICDKIKSIKPYLRPLSSMTKEEDKEYAKVIVKSQDCSFENSESATTMVNDWLLSKGFDVRGLISKGLALEAPEGIYK